MLCLIPAFPSVTRAGDSRVYSDVLSLAYALAIHPGGVFQHLVS